MIPSDLDAAWIWLIAAAALAAIELVTPGFFLIWIAGAALLTGVTAFLLPIELSFQLVLFGLFSILSVVLGRRHYERAAGTGGDPLLKLVDDKGRRFLVRADQIAYVEIAPAERKVGFGLGS